VSSSVGCLGCENGGGPPDCTIRKCADERGYDICSICSELEGCIKFDWLGDYASVLRGKLEANKGKLKKVLIEEAIAEPA
jgi:hypothetical protein